MLKRLVILWMLFSGIIGVKAQSYRFKHITNEDGLSTNYVSAIIQDSKGFMWFGTQDGLCKYDGFQITAFTSDVNDPNSLSSSDITCLYEHEDGRIYIGTRGHGLNIYNPYTNKFTRISSDEKNKNLLSDPLINCFLRGENNTIWIGTENGLNKFDSKTGKNKKYFFPMEKAVNVTSVYLFNNKLFIGTKDEGLWVLVNDKLQKLQIENNSGLKVGNKEINTIKAITAYAGNLYLATYGNGIIMIDPEILEIEKVFYLGQGNNNYNYIEGFKINSNKLYAITRDGFLIYDLIKGTGQRIVKSEVDPKSLNDDQLTSIYIDDQKTIWLGTFSGGVNVSFSQALKFPNLPLEINEQFNGVFAIHESVDGKLWVGGEKFLKLLDKSTNTIKDYSYIIEERNHVLSINQEDENNIWIGTWGLGLFKYNLATKKKKIFLSETAGATIMSIHIDKNGTKWIGTYGDGLFVIDKNEVVKQYSVDNGLNNENVVAVYQDSKNNIWLSTDGGGAICIKEGKIENASNYINYVHGDNSNSICSDNVYSITEDKLHRIWIATNNGLSKLDPASKTFKNYSEDDGLANNTIYAVLEDSVGNLWMSTNKGITKFNPNMANINGAAFRNYEQKDGLKNKEFTQGAFAKLSTSELVFGGGLGINIFDPKFITDNLVVPPVYIINYKRGGSDVISDTVITYKKYIKLSWRENYFQFELAALDYYAPTKNKYVYMLEGYDNEWSTPTNIRYVSYNELPGGDYTFKVKASNNEGVWNEIPCYVYIKVVPPFWKTTWFYITVTILGIAGIVVFTQLRTRAVKRENKILESKVAERTKELEEKNKDITSSIEYANRIQEAILPSKNEIFSKFKDAFILYKPKDIVSGDFYWYGYKNNCKIFAVVDCTGHGVPGAFMSMIGHNVLNQVVMEKATTDPGQILNKLHEGVQSALKQGHNEIDTNDGMDVSIISVNEKTGETLWAGAFRPALIVKENGVLEKISGNRYSVGGAQLEDERVFISHTLEMNRGDIIYLFSDGYADQFGGDSGKKYMLKRFQDDLVQLYSVPMSQQQLALEKSLESWKGSHEQVDDVLVVGIRF